MFKQKRIFLFVLLLLVVLGGCGKKAQTVVDGTQSGNNEQTETKDSQNVQQEDKEQEATQLPENGASREDLYKDAVKIALSDAGVTVNGQTATKETEADVYVANDIIFYLADQGFTYGEGTPDEEHTQAEADEHMVVHIAKPGVYELSGKLTKGQVAVDLGKDAEENPEAVVTLILNGVDITCEVAPAVIFYNVYECNIYNEENATYEVDTTGAGANVVIADGSRNQVNGSHVARIYKSYTLNDAGTEVIDNKKLHKYDGAFYSKMSMNIFGGSKGDGVLNILADNEGLDSEMHLTLNGGIINIEAGNDGINTNEDGISVTTLNGGELHIKVNGSTGEGDGIDSNGWLVINGGTLTAAACSNSMDAGIDSDMGIYVNGGNVMATGNMLDRIEGGKATYAVFTFNGRQKAGSVYTMKDEKGNVVGSWAPENDFSYMIISGDKIGEGSYTMWLGEKQLVASQGESFGGPGGFGDGQFPGEMEMPENGQFPGGAGGFGGGQFPGGMEMPEDGQFPGGPGGFEGGQFPGGMEMPEDGQFPGGMEMPEGGRFSDGMERPQDFGGRGKGNISGSSSTQKADLSDVFKLTSGANYFGNVQVKE